jgi:hypothetical protein
VPDRDAMIQAKGKRFMERYESVRWLLDDVTDEVYGTLVSSKAYERWESRGRDDDALLDEVMPGAVEHIRRMMDELVEDVTGDMDEDDPDEEGDETTAAATAWTKLNEKEQTALIEYGLPDMILDEAIGLGADDEDDDELDDE